MMAAAFFEYGPAEFAGTVVAAIRALM